MTETDIIKVLVTQWGPAGILGTIVILLLRHILTYIDTQRKDYNTFIDKQRVDYQHDKEEMLNIVRIGQGIITTELKDLTFWRQRNNEALEKLTTSVNTLCEKVQKC